ncbi:PadR family transcriptional regulator [Haliscomenobacter hydrossis]|uniref:Transcriptional regulator PadR family protein n=1 Tax=Haliscomenobacter hydrossis (strain ATCC 27775 / DSM 1100 / LMG 10767 / O) TaxID=760192 RepID=F4KVX2_HALH1|nr:helix-turn-helix transcriptional regulator [Haliscomenobacter hydrossis]AEE53547.1 transcriptional regulator PadR family protein [Haliscomenobacter hydrossis DSM 1100]
MQRTHLGEFEELTLLFVAVMHGNAYGVSVMEEIEQQTGRSVNISAVHAALRRLEEKGYVRSEWSEATTQRGGRRKRLFDITQAGRAALEQSRDTYLKLWGQIPGFTLKTNMA